MSDYPSRVIEHYEQKGKEGFVRLDCGHRLRYYPLKFDDGTEIVPVGLPISCWRCGYREEKQQEDEAFEKEQK